MSQCPFPTTITITPRAPPGPYYKVLHASTHQNNKLNGEHKTVYVEFYVHGYGCRAMEVKNTYQTLKDYNGNYVLVTQTLSPTTSISLDICYILNDNYLIFIRIFLTMSLSKSSQVRFASKQPMLLMHSKFCNVYHISTSCTLVLTRLGLITNYLVLLISNISFSNLCIILHRNEFNKKV